MQRRHGYANEVVDTKRIGPTKGVGLCKSVGPHRAVVVVCTGGVAYVKGRGFQQRGRTSLGVSKMGVACGNGLRDSGRGFDRSSEL